MKESLRQAIETEKTLQALLEKSKDEVVEAIRLAPPAAGVHIINNSPRCATISVKAILGTNGLVFSPGYYLPSSQADIVQEAIKPCKTVSDLMNRIHSMAESKKVACVSNSGALLNDGTVAAIEEFCN